MKFLGKWRRHSIPRPWRRILFRRLVNSRLSLILRALAGVAVLVILIFTTLTVFTVLTLEFPMSEPKVVVAPFPVGVDPENKLITENPDLDRFIANSGRMRWQFPSLVPSGRFAQFLAKVTRSSWYQMAIPGGRLLVIFPGERKEEVVKNFGDILRWDREERARFIALVNDNEPTYSEGKFYPERYLVAVDASPEDVAQMVNDRFESEVVARYSKDAEAILPLKDALIIASLLQREAYDFTDMREISGVIWNRMFINMPLQLDATLQYAKGSRPDQPWWPVPIPADKYIDSPYNTYQNKGLPPGAIANPSLEAVLAALNPTITDCLFYFHHRSEFYCSETYEEHVASLRTVFGRGR